MDQKCRMFGKNQNTQSGNGCNRWNSRIDDLKDDRFSSPVLYSCKAIHDEQAVVITQTEDERRDDDVDDIEFG